MFIAVENSTLRDGHHFRRPKPLKPKHFKNRILLERTSLNTTRTSEGKKLPELQCRNFIVILNFVSTKIADLIDKNAKVPKLILKKINVNDMLSYMNAAKTTDPKFNDTIASQASESDDWHLCVSTTSEEDFQG